jgi:hypothetical protein
MTFYTFYLKGVPLYYQINTFIISKKKIVQTVPFEIFIYTLIIHLIPYKLLYQIKRIVDTNAHLPVGMVKI